MKKILASGTALALCAGSVMAGNIDRSGQSSMLLFEPGDYAEFSIRRVDPTISGIGAGTRPTLATPTPGKSSDDMAGSYNNVSAGVKTELKEGLDAALIVDQPFGANTIYPTGTSYFAQGTTASLDSNAITALLRYRFASNVSLFGGLRYQTLSAEANIPFVARYSITADEDQGVGYVLGVAWEKPEIAARVALTYNSAIDYELNAVETYIGGRVPQVLETTLPQSVNLEFETGVAADTLAFGSIRWVDWTEFEVAPIVYSTILTPRPLVYYNDDVFTYNLGVGRRFSENWAGAVSVTYEEQIGGYSLNLGPSDGLASINLGGTYTQGPMEISAGLSYFWIGDAKTFTTDPTVTAANFDDNTGVGFGMRVAYRF